MKSYLFWRRSRCNRLVPTPVFGTRLRRQNFNLAPTQYRQLRRLTIFMWFGSHFTVGVTRRLFHGSPVHFVQFCQLLSLNRYGT